METEPPEVVIDDAERTPDPTTITGFAASVGVGVTTVGVNWAEYP